MFQALGYGWDCILETKTNVKMILPLSVVPFPINLTSEILQRKLTLSSFLCLLNIFFILMETYSTLGTSFSQVY